jgi:solute:Na+ symporter, SSS family
MELSFTHLVGMIIAIVGVYGLGIYAGRKVKNSVDFSISGRKAGSFLVMGTILGTLVGGASTIGTAQLAYLYGFSAWWFTLGGGIGCLVIALFMVRPMHDTTFETIPRFISSSYGQAAGMAAALFVSLGMFINIVPQVFSAQALLTSMFALDLRLAALLTVILAVAYVVFGGAWGTGLMGLTKILLTCLCMIVSGVVAFTLAGGSGGLSSHFTAFPWFSLFGRGVNTDLASAFALIVGVLSSQIYFQGIFSSRDLKAARGGALLSAILAPLIGIGGIMVGLFMRLNYPQINPAQALPLFVLNHLPAWFAGIVLATLLLASIGTGAGLTLGVSTMINRDLFLRLKPQADDRQALLVFRLLIVMVLLLALLVVLMTGGSALILSWSYLSLGLRGATVFFPLLAVIFLKGRISPLAGTVAVILGPLIVIGGTLIKVNLNPLYPGLAAGLVVLLFDFFRNRKNRFAGQE